MTEGYGGVGSVSRVDDNAAGAVTPAADSPVRMIDLPPHDTETSAPEESAVGAAAVDVAVGAAAVDDDGATVVGAGTVDVAAVDVAAVDVAAEQPSPPSAWADPSAPFHPVAFAFNLAKVPGEGEDADPILRDREDGGLVAVFDGMGGAGGTVYQTPDGPRTGAYLASRGVRDVVEKRMLELLEADGELDGAGVAEDLRRRIEQALQMRLSELHAPASGLRSRLLRALPTTMALAVVQRTAPAGRQWTGHLFWAGDSRAYLLSPESGVQQLTTDDIRDRGDALTNLREDSVISNAISADTTFVINQQAVEVDTPFFLMAATDGCFGYLPSPMHFEELILRTLVESPDPQEWSAALQAGISSVTGDDAAMAVLGVGADHDEFTTLFAARTLAVQGELNHLDRIGDDIARLETQLAAARTEHQERTTEYWATYREKYEEFLTTTTDPRNV